MEDFKKEYGFIALGTGLVLASFTAGWFARKYLLEDQAIKPDDILNRVKDEFLKEGSIEGSWIEVTKTPVKKAALETDVYYGGISRYEEDHLVQYEFIAEAYSGVILDIYKL